ncbi:hypothetical protein IQ07DRAFT_596056 [Pyrenochaeta sp. DS3sAY3a]|nr:hypothetical protein IQ07DRAFT_596056 [Pyrenochaeta sp. DS3sAY3a]
MNVKPPIDPQRAAMIRLKLQKLKAFRYELTERMRLTLPLEVRRLVYEQLIDQKTSDDIKAEFSWPGRAQLPAFLRPGTLHPDVHVEIMQSWCEYHEHSALLSKAHDYFDWPLLGTQVTIRECYISSFTVSVRPIEDDPQDEPLEAVLAKELAPFIRGEQRVTSRFSLELDVSRTYSNFFEYRFNGRKPPRQEVIKHIRPMVEVLTSLAPVIAQIRKSSEGRYRPRANLLTPYPRFYGLDLTREQFSWSAEQWADHFLSPEYKAMVRA